MLIFIKIAQIREKEKSTSATTKLNDAIQIFASGENLILEDCVNDIEGFQSMREVEKGMYEIVIDNTIVYMEHKEVVPNE